MSHDPLSVAGAARARSLYATTRTPGERKYAPSAEPHVRIPGRLHAALECDELSFEGFAVLVYLLGRADPRTNMLALTKADMLAALRWRKSRDTLDRLLAELRRDGWIVYDTAAGQRRPILFELRKAALLTKADTA